MPLFGGQRGRRCWLEGAGTIGRVGRSSLYHESTKGRKHEKGDCSKETGTPVCRNGGNSRGVPARKDESTKKRDLGGASGLRGSDPSFVFSSFRAFVIDGTTVGNTPPSARARAKSPPVRRCPAPSGERADPVGDGAPTGYCPGPGDFIPAVSLSVPPLGPGDEDVAQARRPRRARRRIPCGSRGRLRRRPAMRSTMR